MKKNILSVNFFILILFAGQISAQDYGAAIKLSTGGVTLEGMRSFGSQFNTRLGFAFFSTSQDGGGGTEDYEYTADANLSSAYALVDYFPFGQTLRLTGGLMFNFNKADILLTPTNTYSIGGDEYTPDKLGTMSAEISFNKVAPYIGIGLGNPLGGDSGFKFTFDIGTFYQGAPGVDLSATGLIEPSASPDQEATLENNLDWFKWYPIVQFGLAYKF